MSLTLIIGPMFAGKSTKLIEHLNTLITQGISHDKILVINHSSDTRYDSQGLHIVTHDGLKHKCLSMSTLSELPAMLAEKPDIGHIIIEEAHFFSDLYPVVTRVLVNNRLNIVVAGLSGDYNLQPFKASKLLELIPYATNIIKLAAKCDICGQPAHYTQLQPTFNNNPEQNTGSNGQIIVAGKEVFRPVCFKHYFVAAARDS